MRNRGEGGNRFSCDIEDLMIGMACYPQPQVMLGGWHRVAIYTTHFLLKVGHTSGHLLGCHERPQRRPETDHQVHSSSRHAWFFKVGHRLNQDEWIAMQIELQVGV